MALPFVLWSSHILQIKLMALVLVGVLTVFDILTPHSRANSFLVVAASLLVLWLGVKLTDG